MAALVHEMGHIFGLADTYLRGVDWGKPELDKGGPDATKGTQPGAIMSGVSKFHKDGGMLGRDDKNGIVWLYKRRYEGLVLKDCFFPDYELEKDPLGCRTRYPLIFALQHGAEVLAIIVLRDDAGLDVNVRDADGMTALHHAVLNNYTRVVTVHCCSALTSSITRTTTARLRCSLPPRSDSTRSPRSSPRTPKSLLSMPSGP